MTNANPTNRRPQKRALTKSNPFLSLNADRYTVDTILDYFQPVHPWDELQQEKNQILFGSYGSGKSILLKRMQAAAMARNGLFPARPFLGIYLSTQIDVAFTDALSRHATGDRIRARWEDAEERASTIAERWLALTLASSAIAELIEASKRPTFGRVTRPADVIGVYCQLFGYDDREHHSLESLNTAIARSRSEIHSASSTSAIFDAPFADPASRIHLSVVAETIAAVVSQPHFFEEYSFGLKVYYLIDQFECLSPKVQALFTPLMRRGNEYFTKCACRLYGYRPDTAMYGLPVVGDDIFPLFVGYTDEQHEALKSVATSVANKMLAAHNISATITQLFAFSGSKSGKSSEKDLSLDDFLALSSGSVRLFLELCSQVLICATTNNIDWELDAIPANCRRYAAKIWAKRTLERFATSDKTVGIAVRSLIEELCRDAKKAGKALPTSFEIGSDLFALDALSEKSHQALRAGFSADAFRFVEAKDASLFDLPERFAIANVVSAAFGLSPASGKPRVLEPKEIVDKTQSRRSRESTAPVMPARPRLFISTSFAETAVASETRSALRRTFEPHFDVEFGDDSAGGQTLLQKLLRSIATSDVVVFEMGEPTPSILLELGISYALRKRVFVLFNNDNPINTIRTLTSELRSLDIVTYTLDPDRLADARDKILQRINTPLEPADVMEENILKRNLRPKRSDPNAVFLYRSPSQHVWKTVYPIVEDAFRKRIRFIGPEAAPNGSTVLEQIMFCVTLASKDLKVSCYIDTSGTDGKADLGGAFALGVAVALKRSAIRLEQIGEDNKSAISVWQDPYMTWKTSEDIVRAITAGARPNVRSSPRK